MWFHIDLMVYAFPSLSVEKKEPPNTTAQHPGANFETAPSQLRDLRVRGIWWPGWGGSPSATPDWTARTGVWNARSAAFQTWGNSPKRGSSPAKNRDFCNVWIFRQQTWSFMGWNLDMMWELQEIWPTWPTIWEYWNIMVIFLQVGFDYGKLQKNACVIMCFSRCLRYLPHFFGGCYPKYNGLSMVHRQRSYWNGTVRVIVSKDSEYIHRNVALRVARTFSKPR